MKISGIEIKNFHQFKDFNIDLTYPKGHKKQGQPLDKVCFIGQSGTGKTTLLELIPPHVSDYTTDLINKCDQDQFTEPTRFNVQFENNDKFEFVSSIYLDSQNNLIKSKKREIKKNGLVQNSSRIFKQDLDEWIKNVGSKLIYFPANLNFDIDVDDEAGINEDKIIDFNRHKISNIWNLLLNDIQKYQEEELKIRQEISKTVEQASNDLETIQKALKKLEDWKKSEFNPIQDIADKCLNKLLANYNLRVKTELDIKTKEDIGFIKIEDLNKNEIPHGLWSTGTKQVILSALPLYLLKPKHTIILFDEPERSLYPDLQRTIVDFYTELTTDCQFFYSTHSPVIASSFEPWEIVELKFNDKGYVYRELYYEGENNVNNYKWNPKLMRWDDILLRIFDLKDDGSPLRQEKLDELATLNIKYRKLEKTKSLESNEAKVIISAVQNLRKELSSWD